MHIHVSAAASQHWRVRNRPLLLPEESATLLSTRLLQCWQAPAQDNHILNRLQQARSSTAPGRQQEWHARQQLALPPALEARNAVPTMLAAAHQSQLSVQSNNSSTLDIVAAGHVQQTRAFAAPCMTLYHPGYYHCSSVQGQ